MDEREKFDWGMNDAPAGGKCSTGCGGDAVTIERIEVHGAVRPDPLGRLYLRCPYHTNRRLARMSR